MFKKFVVVFAVLLIPFAVNARRGCCSHHGGVAGCADNGRQICNDGTLSPSCTCTPVQPKRQYVPPKVYGCTDSNAINYNSKANVNDGSCIAKKYGCMDKNAINYDSSANVEDSTCKYEKREKRIEIIKYKTKYKKNSKKSKKYKKTIRKGKNGKKEVTYKVIYDSSNNIVEEEKIAEKIIKKAKKRIIEKGTKK